MFPAVLSVNLPAVLISIFLSLSLLVNISVAFESETVFESFINSVFILVLF